MKRSEAIKSKIPKYDTGKPCVNGHISLRYTTSGACIACARLIQSDIYHETRAQAAPARNAEREAKAASKLEKADAVRSLFTYKALLFIHQMNEFLDIVAAMTLARYPMLRRDDCKARTTIKMLSAKVGVQAFLVAAEDAVFLAEVAREMYNAESRRQKEAYEAIHGKQVSQYDRMIALAKHDDLHKPNGFEKWNPNG